MSKFEEKVLLVSLTIKRWGDGKRDEAATAATLAANGAEADAGRFVRNPCGKYLDGVKRAAGRIRNRHLFLTLPWSEATKQRLISTSAYLTYAAEMRGLIAEYDAEVDQFLRNYPAIKAARKIEQNGLFREEDWPDPESLRGYFGARLHTLPLTSASDMRVQIAAEVAEEIRAEMQEAFDAQSKAANEEAFRRLHATVSHLAEKVAEVQASGATGRNRPRLHDSLVDNVKEQCRALRLMNVWDNEDLDRMVAEAEAKLTKTPSAALRVSENARLKVAADAAALAKKMQNLF